MDVKVATVPTTICSRSKLGLNVVSNTQKVPVCKRDETGTAVLIQR